MIETKRMDKYQIMREQGYLIFTGEYSNEDEFLFKPKEKDLNVAVQFINMRLCRCIENYDRDRKYNRNSNLAPIMADISKYIYYALNIISFARKNYEIDIRAFYEYFIKNIKIARSIINLNLDLV